MKHHQIGFSLIELMVAVAIVAILASIALPAYNSYIRTSEQGVVIGNMKGMAMFQEDFFLRNGQYAVGLANIVAIEGAIGWDPRSDDGVTYAVGDPDGDGSTYSVTATHPSGFTTCMVYPANTLCP